MGLDRRKPLIGRANRPVNPPDRGINASLTLFPTGNLFVPGHRLRLDIASSNFPHFDVNPNSGEPEGSMDRPRVALNRVFVDRERPSHPLLPVIHL